MSQKRDVTENRVCFLFARALYSLRSGQVRRKIAELFTKIYFVPRRVCRLSRQRLLARCLHYYYYLHSPALSLSLSRHSLATERIKFATVAAIWYPRKCIFAPAYLALSPVPIHTNVSLHTTQAGLGKIFHRGKLRRAISPSYYTPRFAFSRQAVVSTLDGKHFSGRVNKRNLRLQLASA